MNIISKLTKRIHRYNRLRCIWHTLYTMIFNASHTSRSALKNDRSRWVSFLRYDDVFARTMIYWTNDVPRNFTFYMPRRAFPPPSPPLLIISFIVVLLSLSHTRSFSHAFFLTLSLRAQYILEITIILTIINHDSKSI